MKMDYKQIFDRYPEQAKAPLLLIRNLIITIAQEQGLGNIEESLKWNEPSYLVKTGSAVRLDWKAKTPDHYYLFFNCNTKLIDTFRELYSDTLQFQGNRAIVLSIHEPLPTETIRQCLTLAMNYKTIKHLPLLGA
ncbi:DUF1801 domain-containing protein [Aliivibrio kagoshimensis]|uniref:DUF1801 domain-containing protein n=1 Tax=Aliivibrio kagoshimensis TaxID=2910230 RepID=UPI003D0D6040